jgi:hypothetical protein
MGNLEVIIEREKVDRRKNPVSREPKRERLTVSYIPNNVLADFFLNRVQRELNNKIGKG